MFTAYAGALIATIAAQAAPGPNLLAVAGVALSQGRKPAVFLALGIATGVLLWVALFAFGVSALFEKYPVLAHAIQILGGVYFCWMGFKLIVSAFSQVTSKKLMQTEALAYKAAWRRGLLVVVTNPKAAVMWATITAYLSSGGLSPLGVLGFAPIGSSSAFIIYGCYAVLFSNSTITRQYKKCSNWIDGVFGAFFIAIGLSLFVGGVAQFS